MKKGNTRNLVTVAFWKVDGEGTKKDTVNQRFSSTFNFGAHKDAITAINDKREELFGKDFILSVASHPYPDFPVYTFKVDLDTGEIVGMVEMKNLFQKQAKRAERQNSRHASSASSTSIADAFKKAEAEVKDAKKVVNE